MIIKRMKEWAAAIESRYNGSLLPIACHWIFILLVFFGYRIRIYNLIQSLYPDIGLKSICEYLSICMHYDALSLFFAMLIIVIVSITLRGKVKYAMLSILSILLIFFILFGVEFFRVYETTFQTNFAAREQFTGLSNVIDSARAEFSNEFYVSFLITTLIVAMMNFMLWRREMKIRPPGVVYIRSNRLFVKLPGLLPPALLLVLLLAGLTTDPAIPADKFSARYRKDQTRKYLSILHEFSMNPVYNLVTDETSISPAGPEDTGAGRKPFSFRFNTDSTLNPVRYRRLDSIPRIKKYNIILYFFESTPYKYYEKKIKGSYVIESWHRLEKNSINFRNHYANYPLSANALISVLASAYDLNSKDMLIQKYPDIKLRTLPEILKSHGYRTCLIHTGGLGYAGQQRFLKNRKFDSIIDYNQLIKMKPYNQQVGWGVDERAMIRPGMEFIKHDASKPYLLIFMPVNPHHPYAIPDKKFQITDVPEDVDYRTRNWLNYLNSLHYADASLGMLVDELERESLMDDTLLFLFADHGEAFYQHKMNYNHPLYLYDENVHVPFLIYNKKLFSSPVYYDGITRHVDILPTILDILGIARSPEQEGIPILSSHREQCAILHTSWKDDYMGVVDSNWKYINRTADQIEELYNLGSDPDETNNIAAKNMNLTLRFRAFIKNAIRYKNEYYERILKK